MQMLLYVPSMYDCMYVLHNYLILNKVCVYTLMSGGPNRVQSMYVCMYVYAYVYICMYIMPLYVCMYVVCITNKRRMHVYVLCV